MTNISPQRPEFNRGIWKDLEAWARQTAIKEGMVVIVTGPVFPTQNAETIGKNKVTVPRISASMPEISAFMIMPVLMQ